MIVSQEKIKEFIKEQHAIDGMVSIHDFELWLEEQPTVGEWIPCSERLPEESGRYIVTGAWKGQPRETWMCVFRAFEFGAGWCNDARKPIVDAWMPLPEPYKEEE